MTIVTSDSQLLPSLRTDIEFSSLGNKQAEADSQRQAWLRQMELSQMAMLQADGNLQSSNGQEATRAEKKSSQDQSDNSTSAVLPVHPIVNSPQQESASRSAAESKNSGNAVDTSSAPAPSDASWEQHAPAAMAASQQSVADDAPNKAAQQDDDQPNGDAAATSLALGAVTVVPLSTDIVSSPIQLGMNPGAAGATMQAPQDDVMAVGALSPRATPEGISYGEAAAAGDEETKTSESSAQRAGAEHENAAGQTWQKRVMHVSQDGRDVSVAIRDAALDEHQSAQIVARMAGDAEGSGLRIRNAVVNGKILLKRPKDDRESSPTGEANHSSATTLFSSYDSKEQ